MKKEYFNIELNNIEDEKIKQSTEIILDMLPDYFYTMPASTSGKYHPLFSLGEGGLVRHVKVASKIGEELFRNSVFSNFDNHQKDLIRMAILLHDGFKSGKTYNGHTCTEHPLIMSNFILENKDNLPMTEEDSFTVSRLISTHMGPWTKDKQGNEVLRSPKEPDEIFVHLCDYIASRNFLNVAFENNEIKDSVNRDNIKTLTKKYNKGE